ncbi:MAG: SF1B family DNA helicase RecD2, partial [Desulfovibrionaceae bacterium]
MKSEIQGTIERIVYHNADNGYTVLRMKNVDTGPFTAVGVIHTPTIGSTIKIRGTWVEDPKFGKQIKMEHTEILPPSTISSIKAYLGSGIIKGIGQKIAERIVNEFGEHSLDIIDKMPDRLRIIKGISQTTIERIKESSEEQNTVRSIIMFLQPHGITPAFSVRVFKFYGAEALTIVKENPYRLAMDIKGIGFLTADTIAQKVGFDKESPLRAQAGVLYLLSKIMEEGHVYYPKEDLISKTGDDLCISYHLVSNAIIQLAKDGIIVVEEHEGGKEGIFLSRYYHYEKKICYYLQRLISSPRSTRFKDAQNTVENIISENNLHLAQEQREAIHKASANKVMILTGGPGTGKTTITNLILQVFAHEHAKILLAAPTGRAAKRLCETTGKEAKTIHRLLEYLPKEDRFHHTEDNPLMCNLLVVDESSMIDIVLMYHLLKAIPLGATVLFVGDINQLPSVGAGNVLQDIIESSTVPVVKLVEIFRQASESQIICNAHKINKGEMLSTYNSKELTDFYFIKVEEPEEIAKTIIQYVKEHIPRRFKLHPKRDIQVLSPMLKGTVGASNLNYLLQNALNDSELFLRKGERIYKLDDKVMQCKNNYDKDIFNGDIGYICYLNVEEKEITVRFDEKNISYSYDELDEVLPAYAISIHKSQGSEYPAVVIPITIQHY